MAFLGPPWGLGEQGEKDAYFGGTKAMGTDTILRNRKQFISGEHGNRYHLGGSQFKRRLLFTIKTYVFFLLMQQFNRFCIRADF